MGLHNRAEPTLDRSAGTASRKWEASRGTPAEAHPHGHDRICIEVLLRVPVLELVIVFVLSSILTLNTDLPVLVSRKRRGCCGVREVSSRLEAQLGRHVARPSILPSRVHGNRSLIIDMVPVLVLEY